MHGLSPHQLRKLNPQGVGMVMNAGEEICTVGVTDVTASAVTLFWPVALVFGAVLGGVLSFIYGKHVATVKQQQQPQSHVAEVL